MGHGSDTLLFSIWEGKTSGRRTIFIILQSNKQHVVWWISAQDVPDVSS